MCANVARVRVRVARDCVPRWVDLLVAAADEPFACPPAFCTIPLAVLQPERVAFVEVRLEGGQGAASRRPLVLLGPEVVVREGLAAASGTGVVLPVFLDEVLVHALDFLSSLSINGVLCS